MVSPWTSHGIVTHFRYEKLQEQESKGPGRSFKASYNSVSEIPRPYVCCVLLPKSELLKPTPIKGGEIRIYFLVLGAVGTYRK